MRHQRCGDEEHVVGGITGRSIGGMGDMRHARVFQGKHEVDRDFSGIQIPGSCTRERVLVSRTEIQRGKREFWTSQQGSGWLGLR